MCILKWKEFKIELSLQEKMSVRMGQSLRAGAQIFPSSLFFINPTFCVGSGVRLFQGRFCAYATVINEAPDVCVTFRVGNRKSIPIPESDT